MNTQLRGKCAARILASAAGSFLFATQAMAINIAFINPGGETGFWGNVSGTMQAAADDFGHGLEIIHTNRDRGAMQTAAKDLANRPTPPDFVIVVNEIKQGKKAYATLSQAGIKVMFLLNQLSEAEQKGLDTANLVGGISPDNEIAGYEMAKSLIEAARAAGKDQDGVQIMALLGDLATPASVDRTAGMERAIAEEGDAELVRAIPVNWDAEEAATRTRKFLKNNAADAIWSANDPISFAAQAEADASGLRAGQDVFFAGLNWSRPALEAVQEGRMTMTHGGHFFAGAWSVVLLNDLTGNAALGSVDFPMSAVTGDNVDLFLDRLGDGDWQKIDFTRFSTADGAYDFSAQAILDAAE